MSQEKVKIDDLGFSEEELFSLHPHDDAEAERITAPRYSYWKSVFRVFFRKKINIFVLILLAVVIVFAFVYPPLSGYDEFANLMDSTAKHLSPAAAMEKFGYNIHWILGTGAAGGSTFDAVWHGARISIALALVCAAINLTVGILVGALWGYSKRADKFMLELYNVVGNIPYQLLCSVLVLIFRPQFWTMVFALTITGWLPIAHFFRTQVLIIRDREYNLASRCLGTPIMRITTKNLLPFLTSIIVTQAAVEIPSYIGMEVFLAFIGLGLTETTLGKLITNAQSAMLTPGWQMEFWSPVILASIIAIVLYVAGQNLGDASDPRNHMM